MKFYSPSEKIRDIRKKMHMNQADLEDSNMTRAFISMMESGKRNVSKASSKSLAEKFNIKAKELGLDFNLDDEYFSRKPQEDARFYCEDQLKKENGHAEFEELVAIAIKYELDEILADIYKENAAKYFAEGDYSEAFNNYSNSLGMLKELKKKSGQIYIYNALGACKLRKHEYEEALFYYNQAMSYAKEEDEKESFCKSNYNLALVYSYMQRHKECIEIIDNYILSNTLCEKYDFLINVKLLRTNSLYKLNKKREAAEAYFKLIEEIQDKNDVVLSIIYNNLGEYYYESEEFKEALKYINLAQRLKTKVDKISLPYTLNTKGKIFFKQGLLEESIMILELAISMAEEYGDFPILFENYKELIKTYESLDELEKIKEASMNYLSILEKNNIDEKKGYVLTNLLDAAFKQGDAESVAQLVLQLKDVLQR